MMVVASALVLDALGGFAALHHWLKESPASAYSGACPSGKAAPAQPEGLAFHGAAIRDRDQSLSLTDMWRAAGGDKKKAPAQWLRTDAARDFVAFVAENLKCAEMHVCRTGRGSGGGTWAHWQVAMAYAKYLSPEFHAWCNEVVRERMQSETRRLP